MEGSTLTDDWLHLDRVGELLVLLGQLAVVARHPKAAFENTHLLIFERFTTSKVNAPPLVEDLRDGGEGPERGVLPGAKHGLAQGPVETDSIDQEKVS